jgi:hypothetical protein
MENSKTYYGIDVSQLTLQIAYQIDDIWKDEVIENTVIGIENWLSNLSISESHITFEYSGTYSNPVAYGLNLVGANFSIITTKLILNFSNLFSVFLVLKVYAIQTSNQRFVKISLFFVFVSFN